jgi:hypothetical protein
LPQLIDGANLRYALNVTGAALAKILPAAAITELRER